VPHFPDPVHRIAGRLSDTGTGLHRAPSAAAQATGSITLPSVVLSACTVQMEVGIEDCLHIEFEYSKSKYNLKDVVIGKIYFLLVRIRLKHMELEIRRRESTGSGPNTYNESETLAKYEIMDGCPVRGQ